MKHSAIASILLCCALFLLPLLTLAPKIGEGEDEITKIEKLPPGEQDGQVTLRVLKGETIEEMTIGSYLEGVLRAEMPASFEEEALKAQAAAARTYTYYKIATGGSHGDSADICTDHTCCQAWLEEEQAKANWGKDAEIYDAKIDNAVAATDGQVIRYGGAPILAVFHSSSAGMTRNAGDVWSSDLPYLRSVEAPEQGESIPNYYARAEFTAQEFKEKIAAVAPQADLSGSMSGWVRNAVLSEAGNVDTVEIGGVTMKGTEVRSALGLRSVSFETEVVEDKMVFYTIGYGHGVGLSQYGANELARQGMTWQEIISYYYTGVSIGAYRLP